jgi:hypothetical protein
LMTPLIARMGRRQEEPIWTSLKRHLEAGAETPLRIRLNGDAGGHPIDRPTREKRPPRGVSLREHMTWNFSP